MKTSLCILAAALLCGCAVFEHQAPSVPVNHFKGQLGGLPFDFELAKQTTAEGFLVEQIQGSPFTTNYTRIEIKKLSGTNSPDVIDAAAQLETARWNGINAALDKIGGITKNIAEGTTKGAVEGVK